MKTPSLWSKIRLFVFGSYALFLFHYSASRVLNYFFAPGRDLEVVRARDKKELLEMIHNVEYEYDTGVFLGKKFKHFWMKTASYVQYHLNKGRKAKGDCDEFASYGAEIVLGLENVIDSCIMTVRWVTHDGTFAGHNVGLFRYVRKDGMLSWGHIGNWGFADGFSSPLGVALAVARGGGGRLVGYAMCDKDLKMLYHARG
jgi:hypothetical protein